MKKTLLYIVISIIIILSIVVLSACGAFNEPPSYMDWDDIRELYENNNQNTTELYPPNDNDIIGQPQNPPEENQSDNINENQENNTNEDEEKIQPQPQQPLPSNKDILLVSEVSSLNIRSGPSSSFAVVGSIPKGAMVAFIESVNSNWHKTIYKGKDAYISRNYTKKVEFEKASQHVENIIGEAKQLLGYPYVWGAQRYHWGPPNANINYNFVMGEFDCSSLTQYAYYKGAGVVLDLTTRTQAHQGKTVSRENLQRGDLMFFTNSSRYHLTGNERVGHVAIYLGDNYILHTASTVAIIEPISNLRWSYYITSKRVI